MTAGTATAPAQAAERRPLRVGVNLLWLVPGVVGGSEEYTTGLLRAVADLDPSGVHVTLFALPGFAAAHPDLAATFATVEAPVDGRSKARRVLAESTWLPRAARRRNVDLIHHAGGVVPPGRRRAAVTSVLTIHDLQPLAMPENFSWVKRRWLAAMLPRSVRRSGLVIAPSDPTASSVVERLGVPSAHLRTVPHGVAPYRRPDADLIDEVRRRYRLGDQVVLYPAITYPHKDHVTLVDGFARLASERPGACLVLTGGAGPDEARVTAAIRESGAAGQIRRTDRIPRDDLEALYAVADVVAIPSRFEGFGLPALEAMAAGTPLVAADATALPWVAGEAALLLPAGDVGAWADALRRVLSDPDEAARLRTAGLARSEAFTWQRAGSALVAAYEDAAAMNETGTR